MNREELMSELTDIIQKLDHEDEGTRAANGCLCGVVASMKCGVDDRLLEYMAVFAEAMISILNDPNQTKGEHYE